MPRTIAFVANSARNLTHFRGALLAAVRGAGMRVLALTPPGPEVAALRRAGYHHYPLRWLQRSGANPLRDLALVRELRALFRRHRVHTALLFTAKPVVFGALAARWAGVGSICTLTGLGFAYIRGGRWRWLMDRLYGRALRRADWTFFHNPDDRRQFLASGRVRADHSSVVGGSGIDPRAFPAAPYAAADPDHFLFIGRLLRDKGVGEFVAAARAVHRSHPRARFTIIGEPDAGNPASIGPALARRLNELPGVAYLGARADVRPHLAAAAAVVLPSYREGLPRTLLEGAATARPLVATDVPGCREVCRPGKTGWLVPPRDAGALAEALRKVLDTPVEQRARLGRNARRLVEQRFSVDAVVAAYLARL